MEKPARLISFYLPQFHPIPENDEWWGKGFTEWTNVAKARPLFRGHYQPHVPADLGFYDLRLQETQAAQAEMARKYGIEAFCYWHYWFGNGVRILQRPFDEVLKSGELKFPFCLGWANESWTGIWHGMKDRVLVEQKYPGWDDYQRHFDYLLQAFCDRRYVRVDGRPLFLVYRPQHIPECRRVMEYWRDLAAKAGLPGLHLVAQAPGPQWVPTEYGFDAATISNHDKIRLSFEMKLTQRIRRKMEAYNMFGSVMRRLNRRPLHTYEYREAMRFFVERNVRWEYYPMVIPNWDNTPRCGRNGVVLMDSTPELFREHFREALAVVREYEASRRILFIKSWNEWAEGNHLEPDHKFGHQYLEAIRDEIAAIRRGQMPTA